MRDGLSIAGWAGISLITGKAGMTRWDYFCSPCAMGNWLSPMHTHVIKAEDIINRGGATLVVELYGSDEAGHFSFEKGGHVICDGIARAYAPGEKLQLAPGESVTLMPGDWHAFWGEGGDVLIGEVSTVNDDVTDNVFREPIGRFAEIDEDVAPTHLLVSDYERWLS
jgi:D-lyxose ketol-isomerase